MFGSLKVGERDYNTTDCAMFCISIIFNYTNYMAHKLHYNHTYCPHSEGVEGVDYFSMDPTATDKS